MRITLTSLLLFFFVFNSFSQIQFENGYFIDNNDQRKECLIKNYDWRINPTEFDYKLSINSSSQKATIETVKEFGIYNYSKFVRENIKMDISVSEQSTSDNTFNPQWSDQTLFLKVLIEGEASLYSLTDKHIKLYFYRTISTPIQQLIYKEFKKSNTEIGVNNSFRQQLLNHVNCDDIPDWSISRISYSKKELIRHFIRYNNCQNSTFDNYETKNKSNKFHLKLTPGVNYSSLSISTEEDILADTKENAEFDSEFNFRIGAEFEIIFPFNKGKWGLVLEPTFQQYTTEKELITQSATVDYKSIELPFGIRHYLFLNKNSKIFINCFAITDFSLNSKIDYERSRSDFDINSGFNFALGAGFSHGKISTEFRVYSRRNITSKYILWDSKYNNISLIIGYKIF